MIRLDRVELLHWDVQPHQVIPLAQGVTLITGENGSGKTSILDAIKVGLGARGLGGDRTVDGYLARQAQPVAMIRILVDNRPEPGTRRRPFDPLGEHSQDVVTLAVVYRAGEDGPRPEYYLLDGDVVPIAGPLPSAGARGGPKPLPTASAYRERLKKVGLGERYLKLLCLPQGQIASLCRRDGTQLFDDLYDIIGGRHAFEAWEERLRELNERVREEAAVRTELDGARTSLAALEDRVRRHRQFLGQRERLDTIERALPHVRLAEARGDAERLAHDVGRLEHEIARLADEREAYERAETAARAERERALYEAAEVRTERERVDRERDARRDELAAANARVGTLEELRRAAEGVPVLDGDALRAGLEGTRADLARGQAEARQRDERRRRLLGELERVKRGLLPLPPEVEAFRERLQIDGIPHHVLADVVDVCEDAWRTAVEGFLGRYRFAIVVHEDQQWARAAALARELRYPHGVLAPDVRGSSHSDGESLLRFLTVKEARYRPLVARLVRAVRAGEPPSPLAPVPHHQRLAEDGFLVSRIEATHVAADRLYLGREALAQREREIEVELGVLDAARGEWRAEEARLRAVERTQEAAIAAQERRRAWEVARDEHATVQARAAALREVVKSLDASRTALATRERALAEDARARQDEEATARTLAGQATAALERHERDRANRVGEKAAADDELGRLLAEEPPAPDEGVRAELAQGLAPRALERMRQDIRKQIDGYTADERDPLLPRNFERQRDEVQAVETRLGQLGERLAQTRAAAEEARDQYQRTTRLVFRGYFARLKQAGEALDFGIDGRLEPRDNGRFRCDIRVAVGAKTAVHHDSEDLSGGQKAALSILMAMTAVSLESDGAGFFLIDEPFAASDVHKINELGRFLERTGAQYLVSMPTSADLDQCGAWLQATWTCTRSRGGHDARGRPLLAPPVKLGFAHGARAEPVRAEPVRAEPVRAEPVRAEPVRAEPVREGRVRDDG